jgi:ATP-dependent Clp protease protease subunit
MLSAIPYIIEPGPGGSEKVYDIYSRLLKDRIVFFGYAVSPETANAVVAQLLFLDSQSEDPIQMYINSPGGQVDSGLAVIDTMNLIKAPVHTICVGMCASMGAMLLSAGETGHRAMLPNARVMIHQPLGGVSGQASDIEIEAREIIRIKQSLIKMLAENCGKPYETVLSDCDRNYWMDSEESLAYGIVDKVISTTR